MTPLTPLPPASLGWKPFFTQQWMLLENDSTTPERIPARVVTDRGSEYAVRTQMGDLRAKLGGKLLALSDGEERPTVGDWVLLSSTPGDVRRIEHVFERSTALLRKTIGRSSAAQTIAANVDVALIVSALAVPEAGVAAQRRSLNVRRIERYLKAAETSHLDAIVVVNKADLDPRSDETVQELEASLRGPSVVLVSAETGAGVDALTALIDEGRTAVLVGSSGVGKSSLTNRLLGTQRQLVYEIRDDDARGRHTTTVRQLFELPGGGLLIDTPGMREFALFGGDDLDAGEQQTELAALAAGCRFPDCGHENEPGCAVLEAIAEGRFDAARLEHARKLEREVEYQKARHDALERHKARVKQRAFAKHARRVQSAKRGRE